MNIITNDKIWFSDLYLKRVKHFPVRRVKSNIQLTSFFLLFLLGSVTQHLRYHNTLKSSLIEFHCHQTNCKLFVG